MRKIEVTELFGSLEKKPEYFITCASFESRCLTVAKEIKSIASEIKSVVFHSSEADSILINKESLANLLGDKTVFANLSLSDPIISADSISKTIAPLIENKNGLLLIDITTFTHEQLLILVRFITYLKDKNLTNVDVAVVYNGAAKYSTNTSDEEIWLSRGVKDIRPVIGFSGVFKSSQLTQLVILVGFEHDRARAAIEHIEPAILTLGTGSKAESISPELSDTNQKFEKRLTEFIENISFTFSDVLRIKVSLIDPIQTCNQILDSILPETHNVIVCPMNTKISTLGAALAALHDHRIQLTYVEPLEYNEKGYSEPDVFVRVGKLELFSRL